MLVNRLSLLVAGFCVFFAQAKTVTQLYNLDPDSHLALSAINNANLFIHSCGTARFLTASTNVDGASLSFTFKGTGLTLNVITDKDRGKYTITLDNQPTEISGVSAVQACTPVFTRSNLAYGDHVLTVQSGNQTLADGTFSAKLEFLSIDYTVPDDAAATGTSGQPSAPTTVPLNGNQNAVETSNSLPAGTIAGIVISVLLFLVVLVLAFFLYKAKTASGPNTSGLIYSSPELAPKSPPPMSFHSTPYGGYAEPMTVSNNYDHPPPTGPGFQQQPGAGYHH
jgi:hypothetical protein